MGFRYFEQAAHAAVYNKFRPSPPEKLIEKIVAHVQELLHGPLNEAIDIGCGSGQSTEVLAPYFQKVTGSDPSESQIIEACQKNTLPNVYYKAGSAEKLDYPDASIQLITASQSCHWFDLDKFYSEAERVLVPGGVLAMYGYLLPRPKFGNKYDELCNVVDKYYNIVLGDYIPPESKKVYLDNYKTDDFQNVPFALSPVVRDESVSVEKTATVADLVGYINSWSAFQNFQKHEGGGKAKSILEQVEKELLDLTDSTKRPEEVPLIIKYKYFLLMARKPL